MAIPLGALIAMRAMVSSNSDSNYNHTLDNFPYVDPNFKSNSDSENRPDYFKESLTQKQLDESINNKQIISSPTIKIK